MADGLPWRDGQWFTKQVDEERVLTEPEVADVREIGDQWAQRTTEGDVVGDLYAASSRIVAALRERYAVEWREPLAAVEPVDLGASSTPGEPGAHDDLLAAVHNPREEAVMNRRDLSAPPFPPARVGTPSPETEAQVLPADVAAALRAGREAQGWSLHQAERQTRLARAHLSRMERGLRRPSCAAAEVLVEAYRLDWVAADRLLEVAVPGAGRSAS